MSFRGAAQWRTRNPDMHANVSGFRIAPVGASGMTGGRTSAIILAPALFAHPRHSSALARSEGAGARLAHRAFRSLPLLREARFAALQHGDFSARAALFVRTCSAHGLSVSELLAPVRSNRRRGPVPSRCRVAKRGSRRRTFPRTNDAS